MRKVLLGAVAMLAVAGATAPAMAQEKLTVWWVKGFYKSEDDALYAAIKKFEDKTKIKVDLAQCARLARGRGFGDRLRMTAMIADQFGRAGFVAQIGAAFLAGPTGLAFGHLGLSLPAVAWRAGWGHTVPTHAAPWFFRSANRFSGPPAIRCPAGRQS